MKNIFILFIVSILIEGISALILSYNYSHDKENTGINTPITSIKRNKDSIHPHPYFGYLSHEQFTSQFHSKGRTKLPQIELKNDNTNGTKPIRIALLGGSVADDLFSYINESEDLTNPCNDKSIIVKNLSLRGGKQPQQFHLALHHLEEFDVAINIEGLNEILQTAGKNYPADYPIHSPLLFPSTPELITEVTANSAQLYMSKDSFDYWRNLPFQTPKLISSLLYSISLNKSRKLENRLIEGTKIEELEKKLNIWFKYSMLQKKLLESQEKKNILIFQPIPFLASQKLSFSPDLTKNALKKRRIYQEGMKEIILNHTKEFRSWLDLNKEKEGWEKGSKFVDIYGHLNPSGHRSLSSFVTQALVRNKVCLTAL